MRNSADIGGHAARASSAGWSGERHRQVQARSLAGSLSSEQPPFAGEIVKRLQGLGYAVSTHRMTGGINVLTGAPGKLLPQRYVEMHAILISDPTQQHIARVDGHDTVSVDRCALELARMVQLNLDEG